MGRSFLRKSLTVVLCIVLFSALPIHPAQASVIGDLFCSIPLVTAPFCFSPTKIFTDTLRGFFLLSATMGYLGLWFASIAAALLLQIGSFSQNSFVVTGWPFLQGVANLGFIMALLYIAFSTATGIGNYGAQRMLPRLLIAALLINFSLVIGGLIIDASRLVMAAMIRTSLNNPGITEIGSNLLAQSPSFYDPSNDPKFDPTDPRGSRYRQKPMSVYVITRNTLAPLSDVSETAIVPGCQPQIVPNPIPFLPPITDYRACFLFKNDNYEILLAVLMGNWLVWALFIGLIVVIAGLFVRYIALVLLLMVSPLAYLAIAFPGTESMAKKWWHEFIKFVLFGPISLFVLLLMTKVIDAGKQVSAPALTGGLGGNVAAEFLVKVPITVGLFWGLCFIATKTAMTFGNMGAQGALNVGKRIARIGSGIGLATGGAKLAGRGISAGAKVAGKYASYPIRDYLGERLKPLRKQFSLGEFSDRDKEGKLKRGKVSPARLAAMRQSDRPAYDRIMGARQASEGINDGTIANIATETTLAPTVLIDRNARGQIDKDALDRMLHPISTASTQQREILLTDKEIVKKLDETTRSEILAAAATPDQKRVRDTLWRTLRAIENEAQ